MSFDPGVKLLLAPSFIILSSYRLEHNMISQRDYKVTAEQCCERPPAALSVCGVTGKIFLSGEMCFFKASDDCGTLQEKGTVKEIKFIPVT